MLTERCRDFRPGDILLHNSWDESMRWDNINKRGTCINIGEVGDGYLMWGSNNSGITVLRATKYAITGNYAGFGPCSDWDRLITEIPYDPTQMGDRDEDI